MVVPALLAVAALSGCAGNAPQLPSMSVQPASDTAPMAAVASSPGNTAGSPDAPPGIPVPGAVGSATDIYSHIARGAMACWFAVNGPLKNDYIFHATADAPSRGGKAEITIHQRDPTQPNPRGPKAYVVEIQPTGENSANVRAENRKMSDAYATAMTDDVSRWSKGEEGCAGPTTAAGWVPAPFAATAAAPKPAKKTKTSKVKPKPAQAKPAAQSATQP